MDLEHLTDQELVALYSGGPGRSLNPAHVAGLRRVASRAWREGWNSPDESRSEDDPYREVNVEG